MKEGKRNKAEQDSGWRRRGGKKKREKEPPKWLLSCIKLVISVIRGKSIAEARSIRGNGNSVSFSPSLCHFLSHDFFSAPPSLLFFKDPSIFFVQLGQKKGLHISYTVHRCTENLLTSSQPLVLLA